MTDTDWLERAQQLREAMKAYVSDQWTNAAVSWFKNYADRLLVRAREADTLAQRMSDWEMFALELMKCGHPVGHTQCPRCRDSGEEPGSDDSDTGARACALCDGSGVACVSCERDAARQEVAALTARLAEVERDKMGAEYDAGLERAEVEQQRERAERAESRCAAAVEELRCVEVSAPTLRGDGVTPARTWGASYPLDRVHALLSNLEAAAAERDRRIRDEALVEAWKMADERCYGGACRVRVAIELLRTQPAARPTGEGG